MAKKPYMTIRTADEKAHLIADQLMDALKDFNERHPDPDAERVAE